jgi:hypothetical protein
MYNKPENLHVCDRNRAWVRPHRVVRLIVMATEPLVIRRANQIQSKANKSWRHLLQAAKALFILSQTHCRSQSRHCHLSVLDTPTRRRYLLDSVCHGPTTSSTAVAAAIVAVDAICSWLHAAGCGLAPTRTSSVCPPTRSPRCNLVSSIPSIPIRSWLSTLILSTMTSTQPNAVASNPSPMLSSMASPSTFPLPP